MQDMLSRNVARKLTEGEMSRYKGPIHNIAKQFHFIQNLVDLYWKKWTLCYFPSLIIQQKWHHEKRNVMVGDVVIIADKCLSRGEWKLGRVTAVVPGIDNKVRRVSLQYKNKGSNVFTVIERPVQRIVVILPIDEQSEHS